MFNSNLTHWGRMTYICFSKLTIIGSDNGLLPSWYQAFIWTNAGILLIGPLETNFNEILYQNPYIYIQENAFVYGVWKMTAIMSWPQHVNLREIWPCTFSYSRNHYQNILKLVLVWNRRFTVDIIITNLHAIFTLDEQVFVSTLLSPALARW